MALACAALAAPAAASELWVGLYRHDVTPFSATRYETGYDLKAGWRGEPLEGLARIGRPAPHVLVSGSLAAGTNYAAVGFIWRFGDTPYVRPAIGLAVHDGPTHQVDRRKRVDLGSRILFSPELAVGWPVADGLSLEASWLHLSHAQLFSKQNRGLDSWGLRAVVRLR